MNRTIASIPMLLTLVACAQNSSRQAAQITPSHVAVTTAAPSWKPTRMATATPIPVAIRRRFSQVSTHPIESPKPLVRITHVRAIVPQTIAKESPQPAITPSQVVMLPPEASPKILSYELQPSTVQAGETITGNVTASSNVASVEVRIAAYSINMTKTDIGRFTLAYVVPPIPAAWHGTYPVHIIARNTRGDSTERTTSLTMH